MLDWVIPSIEFGLPFIAKGFVLQRKENSTITNKYPFVRKENWILRNGFPFIEFEFPFIRNAFALQRNLQLTTNRYQR